MAERKDVLVPDKATHYFTHHRSVYFAYSSGGNTYIRMSNNRWEKWHDGDMGLNRARFNIKEIPLEKIMDKYLGEDNVTISL